MMSGGAAFTAARQTPHHVAIINKWCAYERVGGMRSRAEPADGS
jgi:hypothetical protein